MSSAGEKAPAEIYQQRLAAREQEAALLDRRHLILSNARLAVFLTGAALSWLAWISHLFSGWWVLAPVIIFIALAVAHDGVLRRRSRARRAVSFYNRGLDRLADRWVGKGVTGEQFQEADHPFAADLDLFGPGSLFQLLCTARTQVGRGVLASWLKAPAGSEDVVLRQEAVAELRPRLDLREDLALLGQEVAAGVDLNILKKWSGSPPVLTGGPMRLVLLAASILTVATITGWLAGLLGPGPVLLALAFQGILTGRLRARVQQVLEDVEEPGRELFLMAEVLERLAAETYESRLLAGRREALESAAGAPHQAIAHLARLVERLDWRRNKFFAPFGMALAWSSQHAFALESWRRRHGRDVPRWLEAIGEMEALGALAGYAWEHPEDVFPELAPAGEHVLLARGMGHPLLPAATCVRNDLELSHELRLLIVSGSNMSGKSTLLRAIGVNVVLALAGAPVRARCLRLSPLGLGASIRINDSLHEGRSRFYAEIIRLRAIMELAEGDGPLLFLLDEILHGTNSHDRRIGAEAVVRGLVERGAIGLVTTHDLALAKVAEAMAPQAANIHFQDDLVEGRMVFDFRIHEGVVNRSNALDLMRSIGLKV
ncbi:MAG: DNA mismatch repair protein MutS [Acidobacteria bacterium]|nr:MAG: DNA mismatch repair protein MutS [Acidobacteriota bacterium]